MKSRYIILHTHFSIYSHLEEQGYEVVCYEAANYERNQPNAVIYICTDHKGFFKSCCKHYAHDFNITPVVGEFELPAHYRPVFGAPKTATRMVS